MHQLTWAHRVIHPFVKLLVHSPVTPNHLTTLRVITGLVSVGAFAQSNTLWGGIWFVLSAFLDRADGELARLSGKTSDSGRTYDLVSDAAINILLFIGIGIGLRDSVLGHWAISMGIVAGTSVGLIFILVARLELQGKQLIPGAGGFDPDDVMFLVGPIAWLHGILPFLVAAVIGAPAFLLFALRRSRKQQEQGLSR